MEEEPKPKPQVSPELARLLLAIEKYGFSLAFLYFAWAALEVLWTEPAVRWKVATSLEATLKLGPAFIIKQLLVFTFNAFIGVGLLRNSKPTHYPERYSEVLFPMLGTFLALLVNMRESLPPFMLHNPMPVSWLNTASFVAVLVSIFGYSMSIWGIAYLGRSFGALVAVRKVVIAGPYRVVRHPIYCGYLFETLGLIIATFSLFSIIWAILAVGIQVIRAILEERRLAEASPDYREYQKRVGFLLPKLQIGPRS